MRNNADSRRDNGELRAMRRRIAELEGAVAKLEEAGKELRELEKRYRLLFEESLSAAAVIDTSMTLVEANTQMARSLGYDKAELIGRNGLEFVVPRDREMIERTLAGAFRGEDIPRLEVDVIGRAGVRTFLIWASAIRSGPDGDIEGFVINGADITARKQMEQALRAERDLSRRYLDIAGVMLAVVDANEKISMINKTGCEILGYSAGELVKGNWFDLLVPDRARDEVRGVFRKLMAGDVAPVEHYVNPLVRKDGEERLISFHNTVLRGTRGEIRGALLSAEDITDRKRAEEATRQSEARYRRLFEESPVSLWEEGFTAVKAYLDELQESGVKDLREYFLQHPDEVVRCAGLVEVIDVNKATLELYKAESKEELLAGLPAILGEDSYDDFRDQLIPLARGHRLLETEGANYNLRGERIDVAMKWSLLGGWAVDHPRVLVSIVDITQRKRAEEATQALSRKLIVAREQDRRRLAMELHDSLGQKMIALHLIIQSLAGAETTSMPPSVTADLEKLSKGCGELIREVRAICQGLYPATLESLGLGASLKQLAQDCPPDGNIHVDCPVQVERRRFSPEVEIELFRIAQEAVSNALQHSRAERIRIKLRYARGQIALAVTDDGLGFDAAQPSDGGLGLKTMGERARALGGKLEVTSSRGRTRVEVRVPAEPVAED